MANTKFPTKDVRFLATCKPFSREPRGEYRVMVSNDRTVRVWDDVAGHYTTAHTLSERSKARLCREAAKVEIP